MGKFFISYYNTMAKLTKIWLSVLMIISFNNGISAQNKGKSAAKTTAAQTTSNKQDDSKTITPPKKTRIPYDRNKSLADQHPLDVLLEMLGDSLSNRVEHTFNLPVSRSPSNLFLNLNLNLDKSHFINFDISDNGIGKGALNKDASGDFSLEIPSLKEEISFSGKDVIDTFLIPAIKQINTNESKFPINISKDINDYMVILISLCQELLGEKRTFPEEKVDSLIHLSDKMILLQTMISNGYRYLMHRIVFILSKHTLEKLNKNNKALMEVKSQNVELEAQIYKIVGGIANELMAKNAKFNQLLDAITSQIHVLAIPTGPTSKDKDMEKAKQMIKEESITKYYSELIQTLPDKEKEETVIGFGKIKTRGEIENFKPYVSKTFSGVATQNINTKFMDESTLNQVLTSNDDFLIIASSKNLSNDKPGNFIYIIPKHNKIILKNIEYSTPLLGYRNFPRVYKIGNMPAYDRHILAIRVLLHMMFSSIQSDLGSLQELFNLKARVARKDKEQIKETTENLLEMNQQKLLEFVQNNPFVLARIQELYSLSRKPGDAAPAKPSSEEVEDMSDEDSL